MKKSLAFLITALLVAGMLLLSYRQRKLAPEAPDAVIWRLLERSRAGDVQAYLDCFSGGTRAQLEATAREMAIARFSDYLKESGARVKGVAVYDVQKTSGRSATMVVEYVYQDQNEKQRMALRLEGGMWRIESAESSQRVQPLIPYGKPVTEVQ